MLIFGDNFLLFILVKCVCNEGCKIISAPTSPKRFHSLVQSDFFVHKLNSSKISKSIIDREIRRGMTERVDLKTIFTSHHLLLLNSLKLFKTAVFTVTKHSLLCACSLIGTESGSLHDVTFISNAHAAKLTPPTQKLIRGFPTIFEQAFHRFNL